jgi:asparagine synthase (glutamine-hydrolysing)
MCGISGIVSPGVDDPEDDRRLAAMLRALIPRGPDEEGVFHDAGVRLGVRRLKVIDLETGHQPIRTADGALTIVFNGEIYNYLELREQLESRGHRFRTRSDTETVLLGFREWAFDVFDRLDGMFGLAIWDAPSRRLVLARDRMGEKPLYWAEDGGRLVFASEMKAIRRGLRRARAVDRKALARYLFYGYCPSPDSLLDGVHKLRPAEILVYTAAGTVQLRRFWSPGAPPADADVPARLAELRGTTLPVAVRSRLVSDVPVGAFLSGGIDSTLVVQEMTAAEVSPRTFSIGFEDPSFDESAKARLVADQLGTDHTERVFSEENLTSLLGELPRLTDEPLADPSILPTYLLSRLARERVTVALSGDGGDELFGGYPTYLGHRWASMIDGAQGVAGMLVRGVAAALPVSDANLSLDFRLAKLGLGLGHDAARRHALWMSQCTPAQIAALLPDLAGQDLSEMLFEPVADRLAGRTFRTDLDLAMYLDLTLYLAECVLMKVDRASMACSLETRAPLLARGVVEAALSLPASAKVGLRTTKKVLRRLLEARYPASISQQPKKGFGIPVSRWLRTLARESVESVLKELPVDRDAVALLWREHVEGRRNHRMPLWALHVFGLWETQAEPAA